MLVFSAITPHSPLLIPSIGKDNLTLLKKISDAYKKTEEELYTSKPETIIIISPHGKVEENSFTMNLNPEFNINFEEFGDFSTKQRLICNFGLAYKIRERMETRAPLQLISEPNLDYGSAVPLYLLTQHLPQIKIIPIYYSGLDLKAHFEFGELLKREIAVSKDRIAVVASGDLSHCLTKNSPVGYSKKGRKFDQKLLELLAAGKSGEILNIESSLIHEAKECGLKSIVILLGILEGMKYTYNLLAYDAPFGIGYAVANFRI
jgi:aromatic ring-opening dioxygenase LigB subunit